MNRRKFIQSLMGSAAVLALPGAATGAVKTKVVASTRRWAVCPAAYKSVVAPVTTEHGSLGWAFLRVTDEEKAVLCEGPEAPGYDEIIERGERRQNEFLDAMSEEQELEHHLTEDREWLDEGPE